MARLPSQSSRRPSRAARPPIARLAAAGALAWLAVAAGAGQAAVLTVSVTDATGAALQDAVALLDSTTSRPAVKPMADVEIAQRKRQFTPRVTLVTVGTRVSFPNFDTVRHHVYSLSPAKTFELKLYSGVPGTPVVFDKPGVAVLGCNIHDTMAAWVVVADTPWAARSGPDGRARIDGVPAGTYRLRLWHPAMPLNGEPPPVLVTVGNADLEQAVRLPLRDEP